MPLLRQSPSSESDSNGNFQFSHVPLGITYAFETFLPEKNYSNVFESSYSGNLVKVTLTEEQPSADVVIPLGPRPEVTPIAITQAAFRGTINGNVVDGMGQPVAGVSVTLWPIGMSLFGVLPCKDSDNEGNFQFSHVKLGLSYQFSTSLGEQYCPNPFLSLYSDAQGKVTLTEQQPSTDIVISLGPKPGVITGQILDAVTGAPVKTGSSRSGGQTNPSLRWAALHILRTSCESRRERA